MRVETLSGIKVRIAGGDDRNGGGDGPLVVLLHGFGAPGDDLVPLHRQMDVPREVRFAFPEAVLDLAAEMGPMYAGARAWWKIDPSVFEAAARGERRDRTGVVPDGLVRARDLVTALVPALEGLLSAPPGRTVLGGFSQGAMLTLDVALRAERTFAALALMSGSIVALGEWEPLFPRLSGAKIVQSHGRADPLLPFETATRLRDLLTGAGARVQFVEFRGEHTIPGSALDAVAALIREVTGAP